MNASPGLRFWLFSSFGASRVCPEMLKAGVPLKVPPLGNASVGRFFPESCETTVDDARQTLTVKLAGTGYATLPVARRLGFSCAVTVEYAPDFYLAEDDSVYVWGKFVRLVSPPELRIVGVENPVVQLATQTPLGSVATLVAEGLVSGEIGKGFTVVHQDDGDDFVLGHLEPPAKPVRTARASQGHALLASDLLELRAATREYAGPFEVRESGKALFLRAHVQGVPLVFSVVDRPSGDAWRRAYESAQPLRPPFATPIVSGDLQAQPNGDNLRIVALPPGQYFVVLENRAPSPLASAALGIGSADPTAGVNYTIEIGDAP